MPYGGFGPLSHIIQYPNQPCLAAFLHEITRHRHHMLKLETRDHELQPNHTQSVITNFFQLDDMVQQPLGRCQSRDPKFEP